MKPWDTRAATTSPQRGETRHWFWSYGPPCTVRARARGIVPTFEFNADQSRAARAKVEALIKESGAELWIEHDMATHAKLPKAPAYVE